jgi:hypothetical protein
MMIVSVAHHFQEREGILFKLPCGNTSRQEHDAFPQTAEEGAPNIPG